MGNLIAFFEIPSLDFNRAVTFYQRVLKVELEVFEGETEKMASFPSAEGKVSGAISYAEDFTPSSNGVLIHFEVENIEETAEQIIANGGQIVQPKTKIDCEGRGYFALFLDPEGNKVGLYSDK